MIWQTLNSIKLRPRSKPRSGDTRFARIQTRVSTRSSLSKKTLCIYGLEKGPVHLPVNNLIFSSKSLYNNNRNVSINTLTTLNTSHSLPAVSVHTYKRFFIIEVSVIEYSTSIVYAKLKSYL